ncbi:hypothetical protein CW706_06275 [Candidatus Bathyarchaeota archaeon]|nr:MAG: hypothetical protein CW706_06275 [Candidatus Bathyarchaeota archaeon]
MSPTEIQLYEFLKKAGEVPTSSIPRRLMGALPRLTRKGFIEVYKRRTVLWSAKKTKFVRVKMLNKTIK